MYSAFLSSAFGCNDEQLHQFQAFASCFQACFNPCWRPPIDPDAQIPELYWSQLSEDTR